MGQCFYTVRLFSHFFRDVFINSKNHKFTRSWPLSYNFNEEDTVNLNESSSLYNVWEDNALFMSLRIRKNTRQCQESHTNVFNQLIRSFISCKFTAYFWEINHDISLINLKISVEKEGKNICFHWSELRMKCQRRKKPHTNLLWRDKWTIMLCFELVRKIYFFYFQGATIIESDWNYLQHADSYIFVQLHLFCSLFELQMSILSVVGIDFFFFIPVSGKNLSVSCLNTHCMRFIFSSMEGKYTYILFSFFS